MFLVWWLLNMAVWSFRVFLYKQSKYFIHFYLVLRIKRNCQYQSYFLVAKLLYKSKCPSVCMSVSMSVRFRGETWFSKPLIEISLQFCFVQIPLINEHIFCKYFVRLSVGNATKLCYLWMFSSLFILKAFLRFFLILFMQTWLFSIFRGRNFK